MVSVLLCTLCSNVNFSYKFGYFAVDGGSFFHQWLFWVNLFITCVACNVTQKAFIQQIYFNYIFI